MEPKTLTNEEAFAILGGEPTIEDAPVTITEEEAEEIITSLDML